MRHAPPQLPIYNQETDLVKSIRTHIYCPGKRPQTVCVRSISRKLRDLDALGSREVMVVMKAGIVVMVAVVVSVTVSVSVSVCACEV